MVMQRRGGAGTDSDSTPARECCIVPADTFGEAARAEAKAEEGKKKGLGSFGTRVVFGVVCGAVGGGLIFAGTWPFAFGLAFCALLCCNEYLTLQKNAKGMKQAPKSIRRTARVLVPSMIMAAQCGIRTGIFETASFVLLIMLLIKKSSKKKKKSRYVPGPPLAVDRTPGSEQRPGRAPRPESRTAR